MPGPTAPQPPTRQRRRTDAPLAFDADELRSIADTLDKLEANSPDLGIPVFAITGAAIAIEFESAAHEQQTADLRALFDRQKGRQS